MSGRSSIFLSDLRTEAVEDGLKFIHSRDDNADGKNAKFMQEPEGVEVSRIKRILVVPFDFDRDLAFEKIHLVSFGLVPSIFRATFTLLSFHSRDERKLSNRWAILLLPPPPASISLLNSSKFCKQSMMSFNSFGKSTSRIADAWRRSSM